MRRLGLRWRLSAAGLCLLLLAPHALTLTLLAQSGPVTCGCSQRSCCCAPGKSGGRRLPCHGGAPSRSSDGPALRCNHTAPVAWVASDPLLPTPPVARPGTRLVAGDVVLPAARVVAGFRRLDLPPPRLLRVSL